MLIFLSPSKSTTAKLPQTPHSQTDILFPQQAKQIVQSLRKLSLKKLADELQVSDKLAELNYNRYQNWLKTDTKSAIWLYSGDVYNGLDAFTFSEDDISFAQQHLLIVSGLYGLVRPLDAIRPYRLEMKLAYKGPWGKNLYSAWSQKIADYIQTSNEKTILLCASSEYAKAVTENLPDSIRVITARFMQPTNDGLKEKGLFAKYARGALARYVIDNKVQSPDGLENFNVDGFLYSPEHSSENEYVYLVPEDFSLKGRFTKN